MIYQAKGESAVKKKSDLRKYVVKGILFRVINHAPSSERKITNDKRSDSNFGE